MADTVAGRIYQIRLALGDGLRTPMPMTAFAELLTQRAGYAWRPAQISYLETGQRALALDEVELFASLDPLARGPAWLAFGQAPPSIQTPASRFTPTPGAPPGDSATGVPVLPPSDSVRSAEDLLRARREAKLARDKERGTGS